MKSYKKKVLFITNDFAVGGIENYVQLFSSYLIKNQHEVWLHCWQHVLTPHSIKGVHIQSIQFNPTIFFLVRYLTLLIKQNLSLFTFYIQRRVPDLIILNLARSAFFSLPTLLFFKLINPRIKIFFQFHGSESLERKFLYNSLGESGIKILTRLFLYQKAELLVFRCVDRIICFSKYSKNELLVKKFHINESKIVIIPPGKRAEIQQISKVEARKKLGLSTTSPIVLTLTRLEPRKGAFIFLEIAKEIHALDPSCIIVFCSMFEHTILSRETELFFLKHSKLKLGATIHYFQNINSLEVNLFYSAADLFLLPSVDLETFGFTTLDALSFGLPVFGFDIGANKELVKNKTSGILAKNKTQLAKEIAHFIKLPQQQKKALSSNSMEIAKKYNWDRYFSGMKELIEIE